jgi:deoxyadenosine/deoxycytidine kinase
MDLNALEASISSYATNKIFKSPYSDESQLVSFFEGKKIVLEGTIAAAKTSTGRAIVEFVQKRYASAMFYEETINTVLLGKYYNALTAGIKPNPYAHHLQMDTLNRCTAIWHNIFAKTDREEKLIVIDRSFWGNAIFGAMHRAYNNVTVTEYREYCTLLESVSVRDIDYIVYLDVDPIVAHHRAIHIRNRPQERDLQLQYLYDLEKAAFLQIYHQLATKVSNLIVIRNDVFRSPQEILEIIKEAPSKPFDVSSYDIATTIQDSKKRRSFFTKVGDYYTHGH